MCLMLDMCFCYLIHIPLHLHKNCLEKKYITFSTSRLNSTPVQKTP